MDFCILIELSKKKISFLYNRSDGEGKFAPFVGDGSALPLAIYCLGNDIQIGQFAVDEAINKNPHAYTEVFQIMKTRGVYKYKDIQYDYNTLLKNAIERYLAQFFDSVLMGQKGRLEQNIATLPLCFVFNSDIDENERLFIKDCFEKSGYGNLGIEDYDQIVVEASKFATGHAVCVTSDGKNLYINIYETKSNRHLEGFVIPDMGRDPRVEKAIEKLWDSLGYDNYYLNFENEKNILTKIAEEFLSSGELELQQDVLFSDGHTRECFLTLRELENFRFNNDGKIVNDAKNILRKLGISYPDCTIVLRSKAANNGYFKNMFRDEFGPVVNVDRSFRSNVLSQLLQDIKKANYRFTNMPPSQPVVPPTIETNVPSGLIKREVRAKIAEIKGKIRIKNYSEAKALVNSLLEGLHEQHFTNWDSEINAILKEIPIGESKPHRETDQPSEPKPADSEPVVKKVTPEPVVKEPAKEDPKKYQREVRVTLAEAKAKIRKGDLKAAADALLTLKKLLNAKDVFAFDNDIDNVLGPILETPKQKSKEAPAKSAVPPKKMSNAEKLLSAGKFADAKRAFASEGNSAMAQICTELIRSKRAITQHESALDSAKRNRDKAAASKAVKDLSALLKVYNTHNINSAIIEELINNYKSIK